MLEKSPSYIVQLLAPSSQKKTASRKAWSIDVEQTWIPFFLATNVMQDTAIPADALGSPIRLAYDKDGQVKFSKSGKPVSKIAKPLADSISLVRENFTANLKNYALSVRKDHTAEFTQMAKLAITEGQPISDHDKVELDKAIQLHLAEAIEAEKSAVAEAEAVAAAATTASEKREKVTA